MPNIINDAWKVIGRAKRDTKAFLTDRNSTEYSLNKKGEKVFYQTPHGKNAIHGAATKYKKENYLKGLNSDNVDATVRNLKKALSDTMKELSDNEKEAMNPRKQAEYGIQKTGRLKYADTLTKKRGDIVRALGEMGVYVNPEALKHGKIQYETYEESVKEGEYKTMTTQDLKQMKIDVFEESASGKISDNFRDYLLLRLESVENEVEKNEAVNSVVEAAIEEQRDQFVDYIVESYNAGLITDLQRDVMLELASEDYMYSVATPDRIPDYVRQYLEAAEAGDEEGKEEAAKKINEAKDVQDAADDGGCDDGESFSLKEKIKEAKITLTDEEKKLADKLDEKLSKALSGGSDDSGDSSDDDSDDSGKKKGKKSKSDDGDNADDGSDDSGSDDSGDTSTNESAMNDEIWNYVQEAADDGIYSDEEINQIKNTLERVGMI
jgi:hypothetical protein